MLYMTDFEMQPGRQKKILDTFKLSVPLRAHSGCSLFGLEPESHALPYAIMAVQKYITLYSFSTRSQKTCGTTVIPSNRWRFSVLTGYYLLLSQIAIWLKVPSSWIEANNSSTTLRWRKHSKYFLQTFACGVCDVCRSSQTNERLERDW